jgi:hypothetical protein
MGRAPKRSKPKRDNPPAVKEYSSADVGARESVEAIQTVEDECFRRAVSEVIRRQASVLKRLAR